MFVYAQTTVTSAAVESKISEVTCERCGCQFCYEMTRVGVGRGVAPYSIGKAGAHATAVRQAENEVQIRLHQEAELVPCPKCHWVQEELVQKFRLSRHRDLTSLSSMTAVLGTVASLIIALYLSRGPEADKFLIKLALMAPILFLSLSASLVLLRNWLRNRIQPNAKYPEITALPVGVPPAMWKDSLTGHFRLANEALASQEFQGWQIFQINRTNLPQACCNCLETTNLENSYRVSLTPTLQLQVPYCKKCAQKDKRHWLGIAARCIALALCVSILQAVFGPLTSAGNGLAGAAIFFGSLPFAYLFAIRRTTPVQHKTIDVGRGLFGLRFRNSEYKPADRHAVNHLLDSQSSLLHSLYFQSVIQADAA